MFIYGLIVWVACLQSMLVAQGLQKCGYVTINPFTAICCNELVYVRAGVKPACCGHLAYDDFHYLCCDGKLHRRKAPGNAVQCCSQRAFDVRKAVCQNGQVVHRSTEAAAVGSTCCAGEIGWTCCRRDENCCVSVGSGSLDVPGFRPMCCHISSITVKAQCCSAAAQKSGTIPECCDSPRVKPTCCTTAARKFVCCEATIGIPSCCSNIPAYEAHTQRPTPSAQLVPVGYQNTESCCNSPRPQEYCCKRTQTQLMQTQVVVHQSTQECCTQTCCAQTSYVSACCRKRRRSCCGISSSEQRISCCNQPGLTPVCCPGQPRSTNWGNTRVHSNTQKTYTYVNRPRKTYETYTQYPSSYQELHIGQSGPQIPNSSPLSCCRASDVESCCTSGLRRSGGHPLCCPTTKRVNTAYIGNSRNERRHRYHTGGSTSQEKYPSQHWTSERDDLENLLRSEDLQTLGPESETQANEFYYPSSNGNPYLGKRQAHCSGVPYDTSQFICCGGVLQVKLGSQPACCGTSSFDHSTQTCCNGQVRTTCQVDDYPNT